MRPEQIEGDVWLRCERPWVRAERAAIRRKHRSRHRRLLKTATARLMRRLGKRFLDEAPRKVAYLGWEY
jgi:hypothetical protein